MADLLMSAASSLIPKAIDAILPSNPVQSTDVADLPVSGSDRTVVSTQMLPPAPPLPLSTSHTSSRRPNTGVIVPFQIMLQEFTGAIPDSYTYTISGLPKIQTLIKPFRDVVLLRLEAIVFPLAPSYKNPVTVDLAFTPNDVVVAGSSIIDTPGSARLTAGGLHLLQSGVVNCDLQYINNIVKSPIPYSNTPRINFRCHKNPDVATTSTTTLACVCIRGSLHLMHPLAIPLP
ncbi:putative coat protein [Lampyris noctiluca tymovirus-like virus 1]|nr:putative coat protein [Lampyris noctiluca tymovirus-like virus 1]